MIILDGSSHEGGGQIIRTALAFSVLTGSSFGIKNIRKNRDNPGLRPQHLSSVNAAASLCNAKVIGAHTGSTNLDFYPEKLDFKNLNIDIGTAGSITLLLQSILPVIIFSNKRIKIQLKGGTDTNGSMPIDYMMNVFLPHLRKFVEYDAILDRRGYYPKGEGHLTLKFKPRYHLETSFFGLLDIIKADGKYIELIKKGRLMLIKGKSHASKDLMGANVAERQARQAKLLLKDYPTDIDIEYVESASTGSGITLWAIFSDHDELNQSNPIIFGADSLGKKGKKAEIVGEEAAKRMIVQINHDAAVDEYLADQLLPFLALFGGSIKVPIMTEHAKANMYAIESFLGKRFKVDGNIINV